MVNVKRKKGETFESMFRRFTGHLVRSGKLNESKAKRYYVKKLSRNLAKEKALMRLKFVEKKEYLKRIGRLDDSDSRRRKIKL